MVVQDGHWERGMAIGVEVLADDREGLNSSVLDGFKGTKMPLFTLPRLRGSSSNSCLFTFGDDAEHARGL